LYTTSDNKKESAAVEVKLLSVFNNINKIVLLMITGGAMYGGRGHPGAITPKKMFG